MAGLITFLVAQPGWALELEPNKHYRNLTQHITYLESPDRSLDAEQVVGLRQRMEPLPGSRVDFGFSKSRFWLRLPVSNPTARDATWILSTNMRFMQDLSVYAVRDGDIELLAQDGLATPFTERQIEHRHLAVRFEIEPYEHLDIYISYWSEGTTAIPLSMENALSFQQLTSFHNAKNAAFYTFALFMLLYSALFWQFTRSRSFFAYFMYLWTVVLYLLHMDGYTFVYLWPDWPRWNAYASLPLGLSLNVSAAFFSQRFLQTARYHPGLDRAMRLIMITALGLVASSAVADESLLKRTSLVFTLACTIFFLVSGVIAYRKRTVGVRFYVVGWFGLTAAAIITNISHFSAGLLAVGISFELLKIGLVVDATMMGLALLDRFNSIRHNNEELRERQADALRRQLSLQKRLMRLEERYAEAGRKAQERGLQLASASHDLRQPLIALRLAMQSSDGDGTQDTEIKRTLEYLEGLVERYMDVAAQDSPDSPHHVVSLKECFPISPILQNVARMFEADASEKGIELRIVPCATRVRGDPLVIMRVLSNLTGNAVKYTSRGGVLVGCRRRGERLRVSVYDTGPGMAQEVLEVVMAAFERGPEVETNGHGLGLAICSTLALEHKLNLQLASRPGRGTVASFEVEIP